MMDLEAMFENCRETFQDPTFATVRRWKEQHPGRKAIGCFPVYVPEEIIHAAGMLPVALYGGGNMIEIDHADSRIQSFICSISRSTLELGLTDRLADFDGLVFPSICDVARNLSGVWQRNFPGQLSFFIHFAQNIYSINAVPYLRSEYDRLRQALEELGGRPITEEALRRSIAVYNENRALLERLYDLKRRAPAKVSMTEVYTLVRAGGIMLKEEHNALLHQVLPELEARQAHPMDRIRVMLDGAFCEQPPIEVIMGIEQAGCYILDDDFAVGRRWLEAPVPLNGREPDALTALAQAFIAHSTPSPIRYDGPRVRTERFLEKCKALNVDGVLFVWAKFCDPAQFDYVLLKDALDRNHIPHLAIEFEEKMSVFELVRSQVETFVESILFYS
jgi:benzoyl-CoA reductase subunit C